MGSFNPEVSVVAGVGPGLGASLARKFAREGCRVAVLARSSDFVESLQKEIRQQGMEIVAIRADEQIAEPLMNPAAIADAYWALVKQDRSAWSLEIDLRPFREKFFE